MGQYDYILAITYFILFFGIIILLACGIVYVGLTFFKSKRRDEIKKALKPLAIAFSIAILIGAYIGHKLSPNDIDGAILLLLALLPALIIGIFVFHTVNDFLKNLRRPTN